MHILKSCLQLTEELHRCRTEPRARTSKAECQFEHSLVKVKTENWKHCKHWTHSVTSTSFGGFLIQFTGCPQKTEMFWGFLYNKAGENSVWSHVWAPSLSTAWKELLFLLVLHFSTCKRDIMIPTFSQVGTAVNIRWLQFGDSAVIHR